MAYDPERHGRRSIRLPGYDYTQGGAYFVTICVQGRACVLGEVEDGAVRLSGLGEVVASCWRAVPEHVPVALLDAFVVMPNHLHGIVYLTEAPSGADSPRPSLATIIGSFKSASARQSNALRGMAGTFWQRGYYEHIIRSEWSLARLQGYIEANPTRWAEDQLHPGVKAIR